jgi:hypothetical protein
LGAVLLQLLPISDALDVYHKLNNFGLTYSHTEACIWSWYRFYLISFAPLQFTYRTNLHSDRSHFSLLLLVSSFYISLSSDNQPRMVLVAIPGGTSYGLGRSIVVALCKNKNHTPLVLTRLTSKIPQWLIDLEVEVRRVDYASEESLVKGLEGVHTVNILEKILKLLRHVG